VSDDSQKPSWYFPTTAGGPIDGFNDSAREHFEGIHEHFLAREVIQNSIDARKDYDQPVKVLFELKKSKVQEVPGIGELNPYYERALAFAADQEGAAEFYQYAMELSSSDEIFVMRIGDYNTKGLDGSDEDTSGNWARLVRMEGASSRKGAGGGSFGIGKNAAFVASGLRTTFYVSRNSSHELVFEGKVKISSFVDKDNDTKRGSGQFGLKRDVPGAASVRGDESVPAYFFREEQGTDLYIAGYQPSEADWRKLLIRT
jgi:hypothetical protein